MDPISRTASTSTPPPSNGLNGSSNGSSAMPPFPPATFRSFLRALLPPLMDASPTDLERSLLNDDGASDLERKSKRDFEENVARFSAEGGTVIYIAKVRAEDEENEDGSENEPKYTYSISPHLTYTIRHPSTLALIKRSGPAALDPMVPLGMQVHCMNLFAGGDVNTSGAQATPANAVQDGGTGTNSDDTPYASLHSIVSHGVKPFFEAYVGAKAAAAAQAAATASSSDPKGTPSSTVPNGTSASASAATAASQQDKMGIPQTKRKFAELELSLLHLQQNVEIPEAHLVIHPIIQNAVDQARRQRGSSSQSSSKTALSLLPQHLLSDSAFLNTLHAHVNMWIKSIQNVTRLTSTSPRDVSSGTASQEINFWLALEGSLEGIEAQLRSEEVSLVMESLRVAKRFHATVSFVSDTGLGAAVDLVHKYNQLMRDFPLNDLLSSTSLTAISSSLTPIFNHLTRKIKLSPYPIPRALPLVEAISKDFLDACMRVLTSSSTASSAINGASGESGSVAGLGAAGSGSAVVHIRLMYQPFLLFDRTLAELAALFKQWDELMKEFTIVAREMIRKRERFIPIKVVGKHEPLVGRTAYLREWRARHEELVRVVSGTAIGGAGGLGAGTKAKDGKEGGSVLSLGMDMEEEVRQAYELVKRVDVLDTTPEGTELFLAAETAYNERVARVENQIIARLRDRLGTARNANEMFRVFSKFNALFVRPKIRGAIQEYQTQLIDSVKADIQALHSKFKSSYRHSDSYHMSLLRDLPPIAGAILWAKQIERQLLLYMKRVEDVLGKGWELYAEGQRLQGESTAFRKKLDTRPVWEAWLHDINRRNMGVEGRLFEVVRVRKDVDAATLASATAAGAEAVGGSIVQYQLLVNFDPQVITLFKEVRNLLWLGFSVPHAISNMAKDAKRVYPHAVSLMETVRTYGQVLEMLEAETVKDRERTSSGSKSSKSAGPIGVGVEWLVAEWRNEAQKMVGKGMNIRWDYFVNQYDTGRYVAGADGRDNRHIQFVREFASVVSILQDKTNSVIDLYNDILRAIDDLATCPYTSEAFSELLGKIQAAIDRLNLEGYANLEHWVAELDKRIEAVLLHRLVGIIDVWCFEFDPQRNEDDEPLRDVTNTLGTKRRGDKRGKEDGAKTGDAHMAVTPVIHEIRIQNQVIFLDPPIEHARTTWIRQLHEWLGIVCLLRRIQSSRYEIGLQMKEGTLTETTYASLLIQLPSDTLLKPLSLIESKVQELTTYVAKWLQFQSLWDLEAEYVFSRLGDSLASWQQLLTEIKKTRQTFDTSDTKMTLGVVIVDYEQVQARVNAKYDAWQRDILGKFGVKLGTVMREMHASILKARNELEHQTIEGVVGGRRF